MKIAYYLPPDDMPLSGCDLWRMAMPMKIIKRHTEIELTEVNEFSYRLKGGRVVGTNIDPDYFDLVYVARPIAREFVEVLEVLKYSGLKVAMDFDDDFTTIHEENTNNERFTGEILESFEKATALADGVTVTTKQLKEKFGHLNDNFHVIDNFIPEDLIRNGIQPKENVIGWAGGVSVHPRDLQVVGTSVRDFLWKHRDWKFHHVGDGHVNKILKCPTTEFGSVEVLSYMAQIEKFKVGIAPLEESEFNKAKSRLKVLEMAALGVPWVASPLPEYKRARDSYGCGILAYDEDEWLGAFEKYESAEFYRMQQVQRGFKYAEDNTLERNYWRWLEFFEDTLDN